MTARTWALLSHIPGTPQWLAYRKTLAWVREADEAIRRSLESTFGPGYPRFPQDIPRAPAAMSAAIESLRWALRGCIAAERGASAREVIAVLEEHLPAR